MSSNNLQCPSCGSEVPELPGMADENGVKGLMEQNEKLQRRIEYYEQSIANHRKLLINHLQSLEQINED